MSKHTSKATLHAKMEDVCETSTSRQKAPTLDPSGATQLPEDTYSLACSEDGRYLGLGHSRGLSVWCSASLACLAEWLQDRVEIASLQMAGMAEAAYLLGAVDDMGVARVFAYRGEAIHLLSAINVMENINRRSICLTFEISEGGAHGAASISCNGACWLEVYHFPSEVWLKELEAAQLQKQDPSGSVDLKWSPVSTVMKIKPPKIPAGRTSDGPVEAMHMSEFFTHCLALDIIAGSSHQREEQACSRDAGKTRQTSERRCTHHFLLPWGRLFCDSKAKSRPAGFPVAVCVWWTGSRNLLQYSLQKAPKKKSEADVEPLPDELWPNANEILCSAVSRSTRYIAVGLEDGLMCVWDRQTGSPLSVVSLSAADSPFARVQFADNWPASADDWHAFTTEEVYVLVACKSGAIHTVTARREAQTCTVQLTDRPRHSRDLPTVAAAVPFLQSLLFVLQRDGRMFLLDAANKTTVCLLVPLASHLIATPCNPVYALNVKQQTLFIKGSRDPGCSAGGSQSRLLIFRFGESDVTKQHVVSPPQRQQLSRLTLEESCDLYLQQRALSVDGRSRDSQQTWARLKEAAVMLEQRQAGAAVS